MASTSVTDPLNLGLSGLASGIDTSSVVDALMNIAKQPQLALQHKKDQANARSVALGAIKAELNGLKGLADDLSSPGLYANVQSAFSSDSTKVDVVKTSGAGTGGTSITVSRLASSQQRTYSYSENDASDTTIDFGNDASGKPYSQLTVPAGTKIADLATLINGASNIPVYAAAITDPNDPTGNTQLLVLSSRTTGSGGDFSVKSDSTTGLSEIAADAKAHPISTAQQTFDYTPDPVNPTTLTINGTNVNIAANATVDDVVTAINGAGTSVTASKDSNGRLVMTSNTAGSAGNFTASGSQLAAYSATTGQDSTMSNLNAQYSIDGGPLQYATSNIVANAIPGLQLTLKAVSPDPVTITVSSPAPDTDAIKQKVHDFVDSYNALMSDLTSRLNEKPVIPPSQSSDYLKGLFFGDSLLSNIQDRLRTLVSSPIGSNSSLNLLSQIGISTGATTGDGTINQDSVNGKLTIDDDKLSAMLASDPTSVQTLLGGTLGKSGLSQLIDGALGPEVQAGGDFDTLISQANSQVSDYAGQISDWDQRLSDQQDRLKAQFAAMESALSKSQTTQSWLSGQIAGLQANR
ncbi:MAG TPA: flagellar filament capping protein FliD [Thermoleophilaceae bacterium]